jgi:hypothetical protein
LHDKVKQMESLCKLRLMSHVLKIKKNEQ